MTPGEIGVLILIVAAFSAFGITMAYYSYRSG